MTVASVRSVTLSALATYASLPRAYAPQRVCFRQSAMAILCTGTPKDSQSGAWPRMQLEPVGQSGCWDRTRQRSTAAHNTHSHTHSHAHLLEVNLVEDERPDVLKRQRLQPVRLPLDFQERRVLLLRLGARSAALARGYPARTRVHMGYESMRLAWLYGRRGVGFRVTVQGARSSMSEVGTVEPGCVMWNGCSVDCCASTKHSCSCPHTT